MTDREFAPRGPVEIGHFLGAKAQELDQLNVLLQQAHEAAENAEIAWTEHYDDILDELEEDSENGKLPGEDVRISIARRRGGGELWTAHRRAERTVKRLEKAATVAKDAVSAAQSEANLLKAGAS